MPYLFDAPGRFPTVKHRIGELTGLTRLAPLPRLLLLNLVWAGAYWAGAVLGLKMAFVHGNVSAVWPPSGIALAALVIHGPRLSPAVFTGALLATYATGVAAPVALLIATGNMLEALAAFALFAWLPGRSVNVDNPALDNLGSLFRLFGLSALAATLISATIGTSTLTGMGVAPFEAFWNIWRVWWIGDAVGIIIFAPLLILAAQFQVKHLVQLKTPAFAGLAFVSLFLPWAFFSPYIQLGSAQAVAPYVIFPILVWAGLRFGTLGASLSSFLISLTAIYWTAQLQGPFASGGEVESLWQLQVFVGSASFLALALAVTMHERQQAENQSHRLAEVVRQSPVSILITDTAGRIQYVNPRFETTSGYSRAEAIGKSPGILKSGLISAEEYRQIWATLRSGGSWIGEFPNRRKNGQIYWEYGGISPLVDTNGKVTNFVAIREDVTAAKETERRLREALATAEESNLAKTQFLAHMSHELRTPLNAIIGYADFILMAGAKLEPEKVRDYAQSIRDAGQVLTSHITSILDAAEISGGHRDFTLTRQSLRAAAAGVMVLVHPTVTAKNLQVLFDVADDRDPAVLADERGLHQILTNLMGNAVKFTPAGGRITIGFRRAGPMQYVIISDTGPGIPAHLLAQVQKPFERGGDARTASEPGTGLGLAIASSLAQQMDGALTLKNGPSGGLIAEVALQAFDDPPPLGG